MSSKTLKTFLQNFFEKIESMPLSFVEWLLGLASIALIRVFLENTSSGGRGGFGMDSLLVFCQIFYYVVIYLSILLILTIFLKEKITKIARVLLIFFLALWIPPIVDHIVSPLFGTGTQLAYFYQPFDGLIRNFFSFGWYQNPGATVGVRVEVFILLLLLFSYVIIHTKRIWKGIGTVFSVYCIIFFGGSLPSIIALPSGTENISVFFVDTIDKSLVKKNLLDQNLSYSSWAIEYEAYSDATITIFLYILLIIVSTIMIWKIDRRKFFAVLRNSRFFLAGGQICMLIVLGVLLAVMDGNPFPHLHWLNIMYGITAFFASVFSWLFATSINDLHDIKGDALTNTKRPLITKELSLEDMKNFSIAFLVLSLAGGFLAGSYIFFLVLTANALVYLYSSPPFRLKRIPLLNPFLIAVSLLIAVLGGYYAVSIDQHIAVFPKKIFLLVMAVYLLWANIKDLKDFAGDKAMNSYTLPVIFGMEKAKKIIGAMAFLGFVLFPLILRGGIVFWAISLLFGATSFTLVQRKIFSLSRLYALILLYFVFLFFGALILIGNRPAESPANISAAEQEFLENAQNQKTSADPENTAAALAEMMRQMILNARSAPTP